MSHLFVSYDMKEEYEESLGGVEDGEEPGKDHSSSVDYQQAKHPREPQEGE